ncbi:hypothetical protein FH972_025639 [Carpinus fangiana]|uniref:Uncharacterized protein n=1 Tax=Carpinus fangiana TaxID=176857 RepID=A0A5N6L1L1_9ROSI|nr:hypothetical protein FH972_025639 [Carpinus fangiana]
MVGHCDGLQALRRMYASERRLEEDRISAQRRREERTRTKDGQESEGAQCGAVRGIKESAGEGQERGGGHAFSRQR